MRLLGILIFYQNHEFNRSFASMEQKEFFKKHYISVAACLEAKANALLSGHTGDMGELCEIFVKEFLEDSFGGIARIFRGGTVIDSQGNTSKQVDIVISPINTLKISSDKGLYPIESVYGVFSITKKLDHKKIFSKDPRDGGCVENLKTVGMLKPMFHFLFEGSSLKLPDLEFHKASHPYKCVFGYTGDINSGWVDELNQIVQQSPNDCGFLPDLIVVNKKGYIDKRYKNQKAYFDYVDLTKTGNYGSPFIMLVHSLLLFLDWQNALRPEYHLYFNQDLN